MKKFFAVIFCFILSISPFLFASASSFQEQPYYSAIPEPVSDQWTKIFCIFPKDSSQPPFMYVFYCGSDPDTSLQVTVSRSADNKYMFNCVLLTAGTSGSINTGIYMMQYQALTGRFITSRSITQLQNIETSFTINNYPYMYNSGCIINDVSNQVDGLPAVAQIYWGYKAQNKWMDELINISLADIRTRLLNIESLDNDTLQLFDQYMNWIAVFYAPTVSGIDQNIQSILNTVNNIYDLLNQDSEPPSSEDTGFVNDYQSAEGALMQDYGSDLGGALNSSGGISNWANAFSIISNTLQVCVLNNPKLNLLILFTLGLGLAVLVIGRRINK